MSFFTMAGSTILNLLKKPSTLMYPVKGPKLFEATRGRITIEINLCIYCSMCQKKCPTDAIVVQKTEKVWQIDRMKCISCKACVDVCPKKCLHNINQTNGVYGKEDKNNSIEVQKGA